MEPAEVALLLVAREGGRHFESKPQRCAYES